MRALVMQGFGAPTSLRVVELPCRRLGPAIYESAWTRCHSIRSIGKRSRECWPLSIRLTPIAGCPDFDGAGVVEAVGAAVSGFKPGDRVIVRPDRATGQGVLAQYAKVPADKVVDAVPGLSQAQCAILATVARTAYQAFFRPDVMSLKAGQTVLVDGASGGVGGFGIALAHSVGATVAGTCRGGNEDYVRDLGADAVFDYAHRDVVERIKAWKPRGVDVVLDTHSGGHKTELLDVLAPGGLWIIVATLNNDGDIGALKRTAESRGLRCHFLLLDYGPLREDIDNLRALIGKGGIKMPEITTFPLARAAEALQVVKAGGVRGKIVIDINGA